MTPAGNLFALLNDVEDEASSIYERVAEEIKNKREALKKQREEEMERLKIEKKKEDKRLQNKLKRLRKKDNTMTMERLLALERENKSNDRCSWFTTRSLSQISGFSDLSEMSSKVSSVSLAETGSSVSDLGFDGWMQQGRRSWRGRSQGFQVQWGSHEEQDMRKQSTELAEQEIQMEPREKQVMHAANAPVRGNENWNRDSFHRGRGRSYGTTNNGSDSRSEREKGVNGRDRRLKREKSNDESSDASKKDEPDVQYKTLDQYEKELRRLEMSEDATNVAYTPKKKAEDVNSKPKKELRNSLGIVLVYKRIPKYRKPVMESPDQTKPKEEPDQPQKELKKPEPEFSLVSQDFPGLSH